MSLFYDIANAPNIIITTDLEPDDLIALQILFSKLSKEQNIIFIVGEGNALMKSLRLAYYLFLMKVDNCCVIYKGWNSDVNFTDDGKDMDMNLLLECINKYNIRDLDTKTIIEEIKYLNPVIISMKPMREFIQLWMENKSLFKHTILIGYMGFNLRTLYIRYSDEEITQFINSFSKVIFYETFLATGEINSIDKTYFDVFKLPLWIQKVIILWNSFTLANCNKTIERLNNRKRKRDDKEQNNTKEKNPIVGVGNPIVGVGNPIVGSNNTSSNLSLEIDNNVWIGNTEINDKEKEQIMHRNKKIIDNINKDITQFLDADCGLIITLLLDLPKEYLKNGIFMIENGYSKCVEVNNGHILFVQPCQNDKIELFKRHLEFYNNFYK